MNAPREGGAGKADDGSIGRAAAGDPAAMPRPFAAVPISIRWSDLDALNHVNNAQYLLYVQEARLVWLSTLQGDWMNERIMPVVAATRLDYRRQLGWPGTVVVELTATRVGNSSLTIGHRIVAADDPSCVYADGDVVVVWVDPRSARSVPLPDTVRAACQGLAGAG